MLTTGLIDVNIIVDQNKSITVINDGCCADADNESSSRCRFLMV